MRFSFAVFALGVARMVVSALPLTLLTSSLALENRDDTQVSDISIRKFNEPAILIYRRAGEYHVALHREDIDTDHEHWSLHFHPADSSKAAPWRMVHAVAVGERGGGILETYQDWKWSVHNPQHGSDNGRKIEHHVIGTFSNRAKAMEAAGVASYVELTKKYPEQNCADWTKLAVDTLVDNGHINREDHGVGIERFNEVYAQNKESVRERTNTYEAKKATGHVLQSKPGHVSESKGQHVPNPKGQYIPASKGQHVPKPKGQHIPASKGQHVPKPTGQHFPASMGKHVPQAAGPSRMKNPQQKAKAVQNVDAKKKNTGKAPTTRAGTSTNASAGSSKGPAPKRTTGKK